MRPRKEHASLAVRYLFLDESGNFDFSSKGTRYFTLTTVTLDDCQVGSDLIQLRRDLARQDIDLFEQFHASEDRQAIRDRVFASICRHKLRIDVTILDKSLADEHLQKDPDRFYRLAVYMHLRYLIPELLVEADELLIVCAALGTKRQMQAHLDHLRYVIHDVSSVQIPVRAALWMSATEPCLQVADYCCWAVHRKWERGDLRSYDLIAGCIATEYELFGNK